nr:CU044_2847 family protein [Phormidesmis priestleyi]
MNSQRRMAQRFHSIETTIRNYTTHTLNAFRNRAIAEVSEVALKFGTHVDV